MITWADILGKYKEIEIPREHVCNLQQLHEKLELLQAIYEKPMQLTSVYRSTEAHLRIYREKGITDESRIPMKSKHLSGLAADVLDPKQELQKWCRANEIELEDIGLWCEDFAFTKNWCHFQCVAPASKKRFFKP